MVLESKLLKLSIIKGAEFRRQPTKAPDKPELCGNDVNDSTEPSLLGKLQLTISKIASSRFLQGCAPPATAPFADGLRHVIVAESVNRLLPAHGRGQIYRSPPAAQ